MVSNTRLAPVKAVCFAELWTMAGSDELALGELGQM